ncbi:MAG: tRNA-dihydrouridine synthase family protein [Ignavibacteria bacterium]|nr:tRNA-dihydrouridine synthase family protein [Ignavibacteria bacterium]
MNNFQKSILNSLMLAPMEDVTEPPFRLICKKLGADFVFSEFISSEGLIRDAKKAKAKLFFYDEERPVGIQLFGGNEDSMIEAAKIAESENPDFIDINCGCWVKDVAMRGQGAGLLRDLPKMKRIAESVLKNINKPVTLKTRLGWDEKSIVIIEVAKIMEDIGIQALTVHCRYRTQGNKGDADWYWINAIKDSGIKIPVILNGNLKSVYDIDNAFKIHNADAVMIGQTALDNPWIFRQYKQYLKERKFDDNISVKERIEICKEHLKLAVELKGERLGVLEFRKHYSGYLRNLKNISKFRLELMQYLEVEPIMEKLNNFAKSYSEL